MRQTRPLVSRVINSGPNSGSSARRTVGGEDKLPPLLQERVDRVQQFDLRGPLAHEKLQIVEHEHADAAVLAAEAGQAAAAQRLEKLAGKLLGRKVDRRQAAVRFARRGPNAFQQMGLADAGRAVEHQRRQVTRLANDHLGRGDGQPIGVAGHKGLQAGETPPRRGDVRFAPSAGHALPRRCNPQARLHALLQAGVIGEPNHFAVAFG